MSHNYGFRDAGTEKIVEKHSCDFNISTEKGYLKLHGGYAAYIRSLGGVFSELYGNTPAVKTVQDFQKVCNYVAGLLSVWGPDYYTGSKHCKWGKGTSDRYYTDKTFVKGYYAGWSVEDMLNPDRNNRHSTNCNYMAQLVYGKMGKRYSTTRHSDSYIKSVGATKITSKKDLRPGDLVHFHDGKGKWHHVVIVYSVENGHVYLLETGSRWILNRKAIFEFTVNSKNEPTGSYAYGSGSYWVGVHYFSLMDSQPTKKKCRLDVVLPTLRAGASGVWVGNVQWAAHVKPLDFDFGPSTTKAVKAFQKENGLTEDGVVGPKTWAKILQKLG